MLFFYYLEMKKMFNSHYNACRLLLLFVVFALAACNRTTTYKIGVSQCGTGQWREKVNSEMLAAQHLYDENVKVSIACSYDNTNRQIEQIDSLVASGIDLLVVAPNEVEPLTGAIERAWKKGIPVVYFDRRAATEHYTAFIGGSNREAGKTMGYYALSLARDIPRNGRNLFVVEICGAMSTSPASERHDGFAASLKGMEGIDYVYRDAKWSSDEACRIVEEYINAGRTPDIVFCHNDGMATGVYKAVVETGTEGSVKILGVDGLPDEGIEYVKLGHQVGTYVYPTHGEEIVKLSLDILTKQPYERNKYLSGMLVMPANVDMIEMNSRQLISANNHLVTVQNKLEEYFGLYNSQQKILIGSFITIFLLFIAVFMILRAYMQTRKTIRQRQTMNEEQAIFYTDASVRKMHDIFNAPDEDLPPARSQDMIFAEQLNDAIREKMSNPNLKIDELGEQMGLGRVQLYRKVKAITGQSPVELLRQMRLQRAYALLTSTTKTISEIAFEVGFNTPGYFSKCFKEQYGKLPMDLRKE